MTAAYIVNLAKKQNYVKCAITEDAPAFPDCRQAGGRQESIESNNFPTVDGAKQSVARPGSAP